MSRFCFNKKLIIFFIIIILSVVTIKITSPSRNVLTPLENIFRSVLVPLQSGATVVSRGMSGFIGDISSFKKLKDENIELKKKVESLTFDNNQLKEYRQENLRYRKLLKLEEIMVNDFELEAAEVIARNSKSWDRALLLNKGSNQGIQKGMAVITYEGLVGRVGSITSNTAEVILLKNREGAVAGLIQSSRFPGVVEGTTDNSGLLQMIHLPYDAPIENNEVVVSSGLGEIIPKGLRIGYIVGSKAEPNGLMKKAIIKPFVDFNCLEEVYIVTSIKGGN